MKGRHTLFFLLPTFSFILFMSCPSLSWAKDEMTTGHGHSGHAMDESVAPDMTSTGEDHGFHVLEPLFAWADPQISISPPPPLTGKQMGQVHTLNVPPLGYAMNGKVKVFTLIAQPVKRFLTDGRMPDDSIIKEHYRVKGGMHHMSVPKEVKLWGYNGTMPGPTIEAREGDRVRIILKNELPEPTSIHWHGLEVPNDMDGAGGVTQKPVPPGGTFAYEFTLHQVGTYMYHTGFNMMKQDGMGMGGFFVIHPKRYKYKIDKDYTIMLQAFALLPGNDMPNLVTMDFNWFTFNGKVAPDIEVMTVRQGDRVRIRFGNLAMTSHPIHLHGHTWRVVGTEGGPIPESAQWPGNTINVPPGTTRDVEFIASNPGIWRIHCHKLHHVINAHADIPMGVMPRGGMFTFLNVIPR
ncbi:MAG: copper oxidase [Deltaproteobacteria bacterium]|nr:MAG: copper oxidase [Deltaproteobacteria bacterium]